MPEICSCGKCTIWLRSPFQKDIKVMHSIGKVRSLQTGQMGSPWATALTESAELLQVALVGCVLCHCNWLAENCHRLLWVSSFPFLSRSSSIGRGQHFNVRPGPRITGINLSLDFAGMSRLIELCRSPSERNSSDAVLVACLVSFFPQLWPRSVGMQRPAYAGWATKASVGFSSSLQNGDNVSPLLHLIHKILMKIVWDCICERQGLRNWALSYYHSFSSRKI